MADEAKTETAPKPETASAPAPAEAAKAAPAPKAAEAPKPAHAEKAAEAPKPAAAKATPAAAKAAPAKRAKAAPAKRAKAARKAAKTAPAKASPAKASPAKSARRKAAPKAKPARAAKAAPVAAASAAAITRTIVKRTRNIETKGTQTMKNEANKIADSVQAVFGDVNERARVQIERNTRIAEELTELGRGNVEAIVASTKVAAKGVETIGQEVAEYSRKSFEEASAALKAFAELKSPTDFFRLQSEFARTQFDGLVSETSRMSERMIKLAGDVAEPLAGRYTVAADKVKAAVAL